MMKMPEFILWKVADGPICADIVDLVGSWRAALGRAACPTAWVPSARHSWGGVAAYAAAGSISPAFFGLSFASFRRF